MKKISFYIAVLCLVWSCSSNSDKSKSEKWVKQKIGRYYMDLPSDYQVRYLSKDSIKGTITNNHAYLDLAIAYIDPNIFNNDGNVIKVKKIKSVNEKMLSYTKGINKGVIVICLWDTLKSTNMFHGPTRFSGIVLVTKGADKIQQGNLLKIFNSIAPVE